MVVRLLGLNTFVSVVDCGYLDCGYLSTDTNFDLTMVGFYHSCTKSTLQIRVGQLFVKCEGDDPKLEFLPLQNVTSLTLRGRKELRFAWQEGFFNLPTRKRKYAVRFKVKTIL